jgi:hypothetical protein
MRRAVGIEAFAALTPEGMLTPAGLVPWEPDQNGPVDVRRGQVLPKPYPAFGKLTLSDRLAFSCASLLLTCCSETLGEHTGLSVASRYGSLSVDLRYAESVAEGTPRPALFSATLPSSPLTEIAIKYKFKGPNRLFAGGPCAEFDAFEAAWRAVAEGKADAMLAMSVCALEQQDRGSPHVKSESPPPADVAYAVLLRHTRQFAEGYECDIDWQPNHDNGIFARGTDYFGAVVDALRRAHDSVIHVEMDGCSPAVTLTRR